MGWIRSALRLEKVDFAGERPDVGELYRQNLNIAWPATVEGALQSIISSIDTMMVGTLGSAAIAAVGLVAQPRMLLLVVTQALCVGTTAVIARRKGAGNREGANACLQQSMTIMLVMGILLAAVGYAFAEPFLRFAGAKEDTIGMSVSYFQVIALGFPLNCFLLCICAAMRAIGKTRITMVTNVTANLVNVFMNYCLIGGHLGFPALGVRGAAIATVLGTLVATVIAFAFAMQKNGYLRLRIFTLPRFDRSTLRSLLTVGSSSMAESVFLRIGFFINTKLVANLGTESMAVYQVISQVSSLSFTVGDGIAAAGTTLVGQSLGAGRKDLAAANIRISRIISVFTSIALMVLIIVFRRGLATLFTNEEPVILGAQAGFLVVALGMLPQNGRIVYSGCLRGAGDVKFVALCSLVSVAILRPLVTWLLCYPLNGLLPFLMLSCTGPWLSFVVDALARNFLLKHRISTGKWAEIKL